MKKLTKRSLVAAFLLVGLSSQSFAAESLSEAFTNGKVKGELKSYYFDEAYDSANASNNSVWANGIKLGYVTNSFKGLKLGSTFQLSSTTSIDDDAGKQNKTMHASGAVLSEAYLEYKYKNTTFKGGRQFISLPLIKGSGSRLIKESFEGYFLSNTDIPDTLISLGKVTKYQTRTDGVTKTTNSASFSNTNSNVGDTGEFNKIGTDGAISLYIKNNSIKKLAIQAHYVDFIDEVATLYVDAKYKFGGDFKPFVAAQYYNSNYDDNTIDNSSMYGYKIGATLVGFNLHASYTSTDDDGNVTRGIGESATASFTNATSTTGNYIAGTDSWQVGVSKKFNSLDAKIKYTKSDAVLEKNDLEQTYFGLKYKFSGALKNLSASAEYTFYDYGRGNDTKDKNELRTKLIYKF
ncbi:OprD family outer membrane porin [Poseidonibacter lekithochrous]|uniref:OprD family outer membrane porin n=1 Tax=Poseidonibacter TaxID=2321187 RepID=UPI001C091EAE|nr:MULTISPECIES: OprD family outer membrane porin [Poseidonibacter]MBU3015923.1 OprD family outer membrane porin [Poseidonibacter lekithochrous]MDO6829222.1 OprD family outer membrane porin [Poseidonibacter sp. 1_MG-2023]